MEKDQKCVLEKFGVWGGVGGRGKKKGRDREGKQKRQIMHAKDVMMNKKAGQGLPWPLNTLHRVLKKKTVLYKVGYDFLNVSFLLSLIYQYQWDVQPFLHCYGSCHDERNIETSISPRCGGLWSLLDPWNIVCIITMINFETYLHFNEGHFKMELIMFFSKHSQDLLPFLSTVIFLNEPVKNAFLEKYNFVPMLRVGMNCWVFEKMNEWMNE